jgi:hypothetical protein
MAIYSLNHRYVGRTKDSPRTAGAHVRYITRPQAATCVLAERMPSDPLEARAWLDHQEVTDRKNARVIDKVIIALPIELTHEQRVELARDFAEGMSQGRASWMLAVHDGPGEVNEKGEFNPHAHIIFRDRDFETGKRVMELSELDGVQRLRIAWEEHANAALERAGHDARIDRRSLEAQGIDREAEIHVGQNAKVLDERGERPESAQREQTRHVYGEHVPIIVDYPHIDGGKTRTEENEERKARNRARASDLGLDWAEQPGMAAQQRSAMEWVKASHEQRQEAEQAEAARASERPPEAQQDQQPGKEQGDRTAEATDRRQKDEERQRRDEAVDAMVARRRADRQQEQDGGRERGM